jgi:hypothetical protein
MRGPVRRAARAAFAALLALAALGASPNAWSACADMEGGIGGTGAVARGGVGGTGISDVPGTVGVVGVVSEFASVCVNGLEIHYEDATPVTINGRASNATQLALGQVVAVEARSAGGQLAASSITILRMLEGPVTRVDADDRTVFVMGQAVRVTDETVGTVAGQRLADIPAGATVHVSGYRNARGEIVASRFDLGAPQEEQSAIGRMRQRDARTGEMGGMVISFSEERSQGERDVLVRGHWDGERLRASTVVDAPATRMLGRVERAVVESLVTEAARGDRLRVGEHEVRIGRRTRIDGEPDALRIDQRVRVTGVPDRRGGIAAERIEIPRPGQGRPAGPERGAEPRPEGGAERGRGERSREDRSGPGRSERIERGNSGPGRSERGNSGPSRVERIDNSGPSRPERIERLDNSGPGRVERPERSDRSGSNSGPN